MAIRSSLSAPAAVAPDPLNRLNNADELAPETLIPGLEDQPDNRRESPRDEDQRRARIAQRAYEIAQRRGLAPGKEMDDWLQAERELGARDTASRPEDQFTG